ncbi:MAG: 6-bladed beta-propeller [Gemmatimonadota bacterium]
MVAILPHAVGAQDPPGEPWSVSPTPSLELGQLEGAAPYLFNRVFNAIKLSDGRIVVANGDPLEMRIFLADGVFQQAVGRKGRGPGEFDLISSLAEVSVDTLRVQNTRDGFYYYHLPDFSLARTDRGPRASSATPPAGSWEPFGAERFLFSGRASSPVLSPLGTERPRFQLMIWHARSARTDTLGDFLGSEVYRDRNNSVLPPQPVAYGSSTIFAAGADHVFVGDNSEPQISVFAPEGNRLASIPVRTPRLPVTDEDERAFRAAMENGFLFETFPAEFHSTLKDQVERTPIPEYHPYFVDMHVDRAGLLWVQHPAHASASSAAWSIYTPTGELVATAELPRFERVLDIGLDYILGRHLGEYDVEYVHLHTLTRGPG